MTSGGVYIHSACVFECMWSLSDRVLEPEKHELNLVDVGGVKVQVQLQLGDGGCHDTPLWGMDEVSQDADDLLDVLE